MNVFGYETIKEIPLLDSLYLKGKIYDIGFLLKQQNYNKKTSIGMKRRDHLRS